LKYVSKNRVKRINAIASFLSTAPYDIVCLQELFVSRDFETILASVSNHLPFVKLFHGGAVGKGLAIFSRFPIVAATTQAYSLNGSPLDRGADWFAGKAAASVLVTHPVLGQVQVFNTHFFSEGGDDGPEHNRAHRLVNAWEFAKLVKQSAEFGRYVIAAGDFNSVPSTLPMTVVLNHAGLEDAWASLHPPPELSQVGGSHVNPVDAISLYGFTYDSPLDSYSASEHLNTHAPAPQGQRIDYVLFRNPAHSPSIFSSPSPAAPPQLVPTEARVMLTDLVPGHTFSYSDHFGVETTFRIEHPELKKNLLLPDVLADGKVPTIASTVDAASLEKSHLSGEHALRVIDALKTRLKHSNVRARCELRIFVACVVLLVFILIGTAWSPKGSLTPLFVFLGAVVTWVGTTMFNVGFLYGRWEANALQNVIEEMELYVQSNGSGEYGVLRR